MPFHIRPFLTLPLILITLLVLLSGGQSYAEWVKVGTLDDGVTTVYLDPDTVRRIGDLVKLWELWDQTTEQILADTSHRSSKAQSEYDCAQARQRGLSLTWFSGNMGRGKVVTTNSDEGMWKPVTPGSVGETMWKLACGKK